MPIVTIYSKNYCPYCTKAKDLLKRKAINFVDIDVSDNEILQQEMIDRSGGRRTVPQIFINNIHVGGFDDLSALEKSGKLSAMLTAD